MEFSNQIAEVKVSYTPNVPTSKLFKIACSKDAYHLLKANWDMDRIGFVEDFKIILLNRANKVMGIFHAFSGGASGVVADPKVIFATALKAGSCGILASHNHPSGNLKPSQQDIQLTNKLKEAGKFLDLPLLDHIIITPENYYSFADEGML
ncbi:MAG: JAB domain-containing protein [Flammeovirgaceae bacterium]|nr:JAB domain-containing protein [Flammeovirgaceae bacterium]